MSLDSLSYYDEQQKSSFVENYALDLRNMLELSSKLGEYMYELLAGSSFFSLFFFLFTLLFVLLLACSSFSFFFLLFYLFYLPMKFKTVFTRHWVLNFHENFSIKPKAFL